MAAGGDVPGLPGDPGVLLIQIKGTYRKAAI